MAANVMEIYGKYVFNEHVMKERLPSATYKSLKATLEKGQPLDIEVANVVASVMKRWAMEMGATHYTHWFQPLTGITSEKHDGFVSPMKDGTAIMEFSGKELVKGEPDASSFPNGGLRATCEARGYTAWDPTSYAFVKDGVLCIPTAFCSYNGEALDKKTPLLRSMSALSTQACRILKLFGKEVDHVSTTVGAEQEYFLVRKEDYETRQDLILTGRTLFGAMPAKGQELEEHYFGTLRPIVSEYMEDLDNQLWELGIPAKTKHNEVAPCQHELAPIFDTTNIAVDHNLLTMEMMKKVAEKHGLVCLLAEKPFEGVNGSGKHNNWSMTANGVNLLDPGDTPMENLQFLIFLAAVIKAVDQYQDLLRAAVASPGNDHRLGANEAPPAIISMFVGDDLAAVLDAISNDAEYADPGRQRIDLGVDVLPKFKKDNTDRNRTSPFAFTGNKFEFRMPGSSLSIAGPNIMLNTMVADSLMQFADRLEKAEDFDKELDALLAETVKEHRRIIFNGDNYTAEWVTEAKRRGLLDLATTADALPHFSDKKNIELFKRHKIFTESEIRSRQDILLDNYNKVIMIEAATMLDMAKKDILPACLAYERSLAETAEAKKSVGISVENSAEIDLLKKVDSLCTELFARIKNTETLREKADTIKELIPKARFVCDELHSSMSALRAVADELENTVAAEYWPFPTYRDLLFSV